MSGELNGDASAVEVEARTLGWVPEAEFRGGKDRWVDAETFVERGHSVMPMLKKNNEVLLAKLSAATSKLAEMEKAIETANKNTQEVLKFQADEVKRQVDRQIATLRLQKKEAIKAGEHDLAADIDEQLDSVKAQAPKTPTLTTPAPPAPKAVEPWAQEFANDNASWLGVDKKKTGLFQGIADELFAKGLRGVDLLNKAKVEMEEVFAPAPPPDKAASGGGGSRSSSSSSSSGGKSFANLPADAKEVCRQQASKFVGPKAAFKDEASWQKHYAEVYFAQE